MIETIVSALYAPIMMLVQTQHVVEILTGRDSGWNSQRRNAAGDRVARGVGRALAASAGRHRDRHHRVPDLTRRCSPGSRRR